MTHPGQHFIDTIHGCMAAAGTNPTAFSKNIEDFRIFMNKAPLTASLLAAINSSHDAKQIFSHLLLKQVNFPPPCGYIIREINGARTKIFLDDKYHRHSRAPNYFSQSDLSFWINGLEARKSAQAEIMYNCMSIPTLQKVMMETVDTDDDRKQLRDDYLEWSFADRRKTLALYQLCSAYKVPTTIARRIRIQFLVPQDKERVAIEHEHPKSITNASLTFFKKHKERAHTTKMCREIVSDILKRA